MKYNVYTQGAIPIGPVSADNWYVQFCGVGTVNASSASHALRLAKALGWQSPVIAPLHDPRAALPPLAAAPRVGQKLVRAERTEARLPARFLRMPKGEWK